MNFWIQVKLQFSKQQLLEWAGRLADDAKLIVDEAFMDMEPHNSLLSEELPDNVIVLRSFGKFFVISVSQSWMVGEVRQLIIKCVI